MLDAPLPTSLPCSLEGPAQPSRGLSFQPRAGDGSSWALARPSSSTITRPAPPRPPFAGKPPPPPRRKSESGGAPLRMPWKSPGGAAAPLRGPVCLATGDAGAAEGAHWRAGRSQVEHPGLGAGVAGERLSRAEQFAKERTRVAMAASCRAGVLLAPCLLLLLLAAQPMDADQSKAPPLKSAPG